MSTHTELVTASLEEKVDYGVSIVREALEKASKPVLLYTGGKDSTVLMWLIQQATSTLNPIPSLILDHGLHFPETWDFVGEVEKKYEFKLLKARNEDVISKSGGVLGAPIVISELNDQNRAEIHDKLDYREDTFPYSLDSDVGNHLLKTVAMKNAITEQSFDYAFVGIRWDEHSARANEAFFSERDNPAHTRVHPILPFSERDIWHVMLSENLPIHPLYQRGYRSLDSIGAEPLDSRPAWEQELGEGERAGREQDKEELMERLRALGYM